MIKYIYQRGGKQYGREKSNRIKVFRKEEGPRRGGKKRVFTEREGGKLEHLFNETRRGGREILCRTGRNQVRRGGKNPGGEEKRQPV